MANNKSRRRPPGFKHHSKAVDPYSLQQRLDICRLWLNRHEDLQLQEDSGRKVIADCLMAHYPFKEEPREAIAIYIASTELFAERGGRKKEPKITERGRRKPTKQESVYVVGSIDHDYVKIGRSANPRKRFSALQTGYPKELHVFRVFNTDDLDLEKSLHRKFSDYRTYGEWFVVEGDLADWLEEFGKPVPIKNW